MEIWKSIPGWENYEISTCGKVRSLNYNHTGKIKELSPGNIRGYLVILFSSNGKKKQFYIHQLMAITFLNHTPDYYNKIIDHKNNIRTDNRLDNLQIITHRENSTKDRKRNLPTGVSLLKNGKYRSQIWKNNKKVSLGNFLTPEEASEAYQNNLKLI